MTSSHSEGKYGIKTVWIDAAEPEHNGAGKEGTWKMAKGTDAEVGEAWIQQHAKTFADGFATKGIEPSDYFILPRHAWAGSWRYSAALWSGDIESTFTELALQIKVLQGVMMSGPALWTTDIGGYYGGTPADPTFQELIVRWFQFGASGNSVHPPSAPVATLSIHPLHQWQLCPPTLCTSGNSVVHPLHQ